FRHTVLLSASSSGGVAEAITLDTQSECYASAEDLPAGSRQRGDLWMYLGCEIRFLSVSGGAIRRNRYGRDAPRPAARASVPRPGRRNIGPRDPSRLRADRRRL